LRKRKRVMPCSEFVDGVRPKGVEKEADVKKRKDLLRMIGYKF